jgi:hypothetical protein
MAGRQAIPVEVGFSGTVLKPFEGMVKSAAGAPLGQVDAGGSILAKNKAVANSAVSPLSLLIRSPGCAFQPLRACSPTSISAAGSLSAFSALNMDFSCSRSFHIFARRTRAMAEDGCIAALISNTSNALA